MTKRIRIACEAADAISFHQLLAFQGNLKSLSTENFERLRASIIKHGFSFAVHAWVGPDGRRHIIDGHQRTKTIARMVEEEEFECPPIPVVWVEADSLGEAKRKILAGTSQYGRMTADSLDEFIRENDIELMEVVETMHFAEVDFDDLEKRANPTASPGGGTGDENKIPDAPTIPETRPGDIYVMGVHRLMCGDSTSIDDFYRLMAGGRAHICFTSPPYNAGQLNVAGNETTGKKYNSHNDNMTESDYFDFLVANINCIMAHADECFYNIGLVESNKRVIIDAMAHFRAAFKDIIYWKKSSVAPHIVPGIINNLVEFILCFGDTPGRKFKHAQFSQGTYWNVIEGSNASGNPYADIHKATFPMYLPENIIENFTPKSGGIVIDCFGGTGTTMIAAEKLGRRCFMMEKDPVYCDVIRQRWEEYTGLDAIRQRAD